MAPAGNSGSTAGVRSLQQTPTWALATVCFVIIAVSILLEHLIHLFSNWLKKNRKTALFEAIDRLKSVLMVLGFMSLILTVIQGPVSKICIPNKYAYKMLPCNRNKQTQPSNLYYPSDHCTSKGKTSLISKGGMNQLSFFIFVLAVMQIVYSLATMALGRAKMRRWKAWERETQTAQYLAANDPNRFRITRQTTFARRHVSSCTKTSIQLWIKCFLRQFFNSVAKVDYLTLRHGFIYAHLSNNNSFNFQKYIQRSLDDDFKSVVGISPFMWLTVVIFMLVDVHGWQIYLWMSFLPLIIVLVVGTKLEVIVARMALGIRDQSSVTRGTPLVEPNDKHFWFRHPHFVLTLLHYTLFLNSFEIAFFVWVTWQFGIKSCYHERPEFIVTRIVLAVTVQVMCSYITLPLYALVTQMGSSYKSAIVEEQTAKALRRWHAAVREKRRKHHIQESDNSNSNENGNNNGSNNHNDDNNSNRDSDQLVHNSAVSTSDHFKFSNQRSPTLREMVGDKGIELGLSDMAQVTKS